MTGLEAVESYFTGWITRNAEAVLAALTEGGTYEDPTTRGPVSGAAFRGYMEGLWSAFPDLSFETGAPHAAGPDRVAAEWVMTGTNTGSMMGLPPTGRTVRLAGADFFTLSGDRIAAVHGYFDSAAIPRQLGLDVIVQPSAIGPFRFGTATMVQTGRTDEPVAFSITSLEAIDEEAAQKVREGSRDSMIDMLAMPGFIGATTARIGNRMVTVSAWDDPDAPRRTMREGRHAEVMRGIPDGSLARHGFTSVWVKERVNPVYVRCDACGKMTRGPEPDATCACGAPLRDPQPYW
jgi:steroid delta-isomerase-like uncharacterized protein